MKISNVEVKEKSTVELTIVVSAEEFEAAIQKAYLKNRGSISVTGFRKGKATRKMIESMYGTEVFYQDAIEDVYPAAYEAAVKEQGLDEVGYPKLEIVETSKDGMTFKALVSVRPEVTLGEYKGLTAPQDVVAVTEADIDEEMEPFVKRATRLVSVEREIKHGDTAVVDFEGFDNGEAFEGGKGENYSLEIGSGSFVPGFEDQLIGMKVGDQGDINITFPAEYVPELAGKAVVFKVKINEVKESQNPTVDDEFAKDVSEFETLAAFRKDLSEKLVVRREADSKGAYEDSIMMQLVESMECEIPDTMVDTQVDRIVEDYAMRLQNQGMKLDDYMSMTGMDINGMRNSVRPAALRQLEMELVLSAVANAESIVISDEDLEAEMVRLSEQYKVDIAQVRMSVPAESLRADLCRRKASDIVMESAKIGPAPEKKEQAVEEKPKRARKKAEPAAESEEKPKRTRKKATAEEAKAE